MDHSSSRMPDMPLVIYGQFVGGTGQGTLVSKSIQRLCRDLFLASEAELIVLSQVL